MCATIVHKTASKHPFVKDMSHRFTKLRAAVESASEVPHNGLKGARIEVEVAKLLQEILPTKYTIKTNQIVIDVWGQTSKECDIVIIDNTQHFDLFLNYVPIEMVYGVIEVKKTLDHKAANDFKGKVMDFRKLNFRGNYPIGTETHLKEIKFHFSPPSYNLFAIDSTFNEFENFVARTYVEPFGNVAYKVQNDYSPYSTSYMCITSSMDQGFSRNASVHCRSYFALAEEGEDGPSKKVSGKSYNVSGAKALYMFLNELEYVLSCKKIVPSFDNRAYLDYCEQFGIIIQADSDRIFEIINSIEDF